MPSTVDYSFDPELESQHQMLLQRQKMSELLASRTAAPQHIVGRMSPFQALADVGGNIMSQKMQMDNIAEGRKLNEAYHTKLAEGIKDYMRQRMGVAATPGSVQDTTQEGTGSFDMSGSTGPANVAATPAVAGDPRGAMIAALTSRNPLVRSIGTMDYTHEQKRTDPYTLAPDATRITPASEGRPQEVVKNPKPAEHAVPDGWEKHLPAGATAAGRGAFKMAGADGLPDVYTMEFERGEFKGFKKLDSSPKPAAVHISQPPAATVTTVVDPKDPTKQLQVDARTYRGGSIGSPGVIGHSGRESDTQKRENKRQFNMQGIGSSIQQAEDLLDGVVRGADGVVKPGTKPTGSGIGTAVDAAAGFFGKSPAGAVEATRLKAIGGALVSKVPRMEGPQSDKDVLLYKQMAGQVGDSTIPLDQRKAALETVKNLWGKYERLNPEAFADRRAADAGGDSNVVNFADLPK